MSINHYFKKSVGGCQKDFIEFVKAVNTDLEDESIEDIDFLVQRVAQNLLYFEDNLETAKSDYITLVGMLLKRESFLKVRWRDEVIS